MDLFDIGNENSNDEVNSSSDNQVNILIWTKRVKGRLNMYMHGWNLEKKELAKKHSDLKKALGCNGSLKKNKVFGRVYDKSGEIDMKTMKNVKDIVFHLQSGDVDKLKEMLIENGVNEGDIEIKNI